jgi:hypothetical protein
MPAISLSTYTVRILDRIGKPVRDLNRWPDGSSFTALIEKYLGARRGHVLDDPHKQTALRVLDFVTWGKCVSGTAERGDYGFGSTLFDMEVQKVSHDRQPTEADLIPYYFLFETHPGADEGILILERFGRGGIKGPLGSDLDAYLRDQYPEFRLDIRPLVTQQMIDQFLGNGRIVRIRLVRFGIPSDIADRYDIGHEEEEGIAEFRITAKRGRHIPLLDRIRAVLAGDLDLPRFLEVGGFQYDDVKIEFELGGRRRTLDLLHPNHFWPSIDVTDEVELDDDRHPVFASVDDIARSLASDIRRLMGGRDV